MPNTIRNWLLAGLGVLGIGVVMGQVLPRENRAGGPRPGTAPLTTKEAVPPRQRGDGAALGALRTELSMLRSELSALREDVESGPEREPKPNPEEGLEDEAPRAAERPASEAEARQHFSDFYAATFTEQAVDAAWGTERKRAIRDYFNPDDFPGSRIESVDCRDTLCRVLIQHDDAKALALLSAASGRGPLRDGAASLADRTHNTTELYLGRQGVTFEMPPLE